jgi:kynurenine formamidase
MWWVEDRHKPTIDEAMARLAHLHEHGPTAFAFTPARRFGPDGQPVRALPV